MKLHPKHFSLTVALAIAGLCAPAVALGVDAGREWVVDCANRALPSQAAVGEMLGQHNAGQVYAARSRLMVEVNRACHRTGTSHVRLVLAPAGRRSHDARRDLRADSQALAGQ